MVVSPALSILALSTLAAGDFADTLYEQGDYEAARVEYQREAFESGELLPSFRAGECLWQLGDFEAAADHFGAVEHPSFQLASAESRYWMGDLQAAELQLRSMPTSVEVSYRLAWIQVRQGQDWTADLPSGSPLAQDLLAMPPLRPRSPALAGSLSAVLPGAGQLYAGAPRDALSALLVNGALIGATTGLVLREQYIGASLTGVLALSFYTGNIYAAVNATHKRNRRLEQERLEALAEEHEMRLTADEELQVHGLVGEGW